MPFTLPPLPYALDALEPVISAEALELHYAGHHAAYVEKLNAALKDQNWQDPKQKDGESVEHLLSRLASLPEAVREPVRKFGGGHANHSLLWETLTPNPGQPSAHLQKLINRDFGSLKALRAVLEKDAAALFGSGWVFLAWNPDSEALELRALPDQDSPLTQGLRPLLPCDLWEHAHYLDYRNKREDWVRDWWNLIDWRQVEKRLDMPI